MPLYWGNTVLFSNACLTTTDALSSGLSTWYLKLWREIEPLLRGLAMYQLGWYHSCLWHHFPVANVPIRFLPQVTLQKKCLIILIGWATSWGKNNKIKVDFNLQWKTSHGVFPCEILDVIQWMEGKQPKTGEGKGRREEGKFARVIFGQGLLPTKGSWNGFRISKCCWQLATLGVRHLRRKALERILPFYTLAYLKGQVIMLTMFEKKVTSHFGFFFFFCLNK